KNRHGIADRLLLDAASQLESTGLTTPTQLAAFTQMLCTCAYNAAQAGDRDRFSELPDQPFELGEHDRQIRSQITLYLARATGSRCTLRQVGSLAPCSGNISLSASTGTSQASRMVAWA